MTLLVETGVLQPNRGRLARLGWPPAVVWVAALLVGLAMLLPLVYVLLRTLASGAETWDLLSRVRVLETLGRTALLVLIVTITSIAMAVPLAWLTIRTDIPFRRLWSVITVLPLVIPSYVGGFVVIAALGPMGMIQQSLSGPFGINRLPEIYGLPGAVLTLTLLSYPYVLLTVRGALWGLDPSLEETSKSLGQGSWATFFRVVLPQLRPAIAAGSLLVALYTISDFGAVSLLGYEAFTYVVYLQFDAGAHTMAAASSLVLVLLALSILVTEAGTRGHSSYYRTTLGAIRAPTLTPLGRWRWPALAFCMVVVLLALIAPVGVLGYWLWKGVVSGQSLGLTYGMVANSMYVSVLAALSAVIVSLPVAFLTTRYGGLGSILMERVTYVGFGLPGIVVALALVYFGANYVMPAYQTLALLIAGYILMFLPAAVGAVRASLLQINPRLEEAALGLGRRPYPVFATVTLPLIRPGILAGMALVFLLTMKELPATLILGPLGFQTLATSVWSSVEAALFAQAAAPALLLILLASVPMAFLMLSERRLTQ